MKIHALNKAPEQIVRYQRCKACDFLFRLPVLRAYQEACCPRCLTKAISGRDWSLNRLLAISIAMLLLMPIAYTQPLLNIRLLGVNISANLLDGIWQMNQQGDFITATLVSFCTIGAPLILTLAILYLSIAHTLHMNLRPALLILGRLKEWVMLDIYLIGLIVAAIKVQEYADISMGNGLVAYLLLTLLSLLTLIHLNIEYLWQRFYPTKDKQIINETLWVCTHCQHTAQRDQFQRCPRCHRPQHLREPYSLQKTWAALIAATIFLFPANLLPISIVYAKGVRIEDTLISGVVTLVKTGNIPIASVVFIASIVVPFSKIIVLANVLICISKKTQPGHRTRLRLLRIVSWIGRWSMLDLFVIALTMSLVSREQLLSFTMGPAAVYFAVAVVLTLLAVHWLDKRLIWDSHATGRQSKHHRKCDY